MLLVYGSKLSQLPRICAVEAVGIGAISRLLRTPYLQPHNSLIYNLEEKG